MKTQTKEDIKKYKQAYYKKNIQKYTERNRLNSRIRSIELLEDKASEEELCQMIDKLSTDDIIYKLTYILENTQENTLKKIPKNKPEELSVSFW